MRPLRTSKPEVEEVDDEEVVGEEVCDGEVEVGDERGEVEGEEIAVLIFVVRERKSGMLSRCSKDRSGGGGGGGDGSSR